MRTAILTTAAAAFAIAGNAAARDSRTATENRDVPRFERVQLMGAAELQIVVGGEASVEITTRRDHLDAVETLVREGILVIDTRDRRKGDADVVIEIATPSLVGLDVHGAGDIDIAGVSAETFDIDVAGAADISIDGTCGALTLHVSGAGDIDADDLECETALVRLKGASDIDVYASRAVDVDISGVGDVTVYGGPSEVKKKSGFLGEVTIK